MTRTVAVVAHFDPDNLLDPTFRNILACLQEVCDQIVLVTTCSLPVSEIPTDPSITTIQRPNIGYDFYSYRVGINEICRRGGYDKVFLVNSSFIVLDDQRFVIALNEMVDKLRETSIVGLTNSIQFESHLQSYLILLRGELIIRHWYQKWLQSIEPRDGKLETIMANELGFARAVAKNMVSSTAIFCPNQREVIRAYLSWMQRLIRFTGLIGFLRQHRLREIKEYNPVHFCARALAEQFGLVKAELLRDNPHCLDIGWVDKFTSANKRDEIHSFIERSKHHYRSASNGLTIFKNVGSYLPACRVVFSSPLARPGVRVAVVVHVFYPELIDEICGLLRNILEPFDLFVTTPHEGAIPSIFNKLTKFAQCVVVALCENRGRDIGPFMALHRQHLLNPYEAILKLHTKKSTYSDQGEFWRKSLFRELCGDPIIVQRNLGLLRCGRVGIIGPHSCYLSHTQFWGADKEKVKDLLNSMDIQYSTIDPPLGFFAGSMFWFTPQALSLLHAIPREQLAFELESGQQDGTLAHALERVFCDVVRSAGFIVSSITLGGEEINKTISDGNTVPVLALTGANS